LYRKNYKKAKELERRNRSFQNVDKWNFNFGLKKEPKKTVLIFW
jgi:hypothetical protein